MKVKSLGYDAVYFGTQVETSGGNSRITEDGGHTFS
jgi:hypothetical protein